MIWTGMWLMCWFSLLCETAQRRLQMVHTDAKRAEHTFIERQSPTMIIRLFALTDGPESLGHPECRLQYHKTNWYLVVIGLFLSLYTCLIYGCKADVCQWRHQVMTV